MKRKAAMVEEHPKGSGRYRVRARVDGKVRPLAAGLSLADATEVADAYQQVKHESEIREGVTLAQFGTGFLARREQAGVRGIRSDRNRWKNHVAADPIGKLPVATIGRRDVKEWTDRLTGLAYTTKVCALNLLRVALAEAVDRELLASNPARDVKIHRSARAKSTDGLEGILLPAEQAALLAVVPKRELPTVVFALCTGIRQGEQWWLRWEDVLPDRIIVRRSSRGLPPKSGEPRPVPLLPAARSALEAVAGRSEWVFPAARGGRRDEAKAPRGWSKWVAAAGITRTIRWHDLRHTCATSLLAGWWSPDGRRWTLDEVCKLLGHSSVQVTERYARKLDQTLELAVAATSGPMIPLGITDGAKSKETPRLSGAFVKHRSSVQVRQSAQVLSGDRWDRDGIIGARVALTPDAARFALGLAADRMLGRRKALPLLWAKSREWFRRAEVAA